MISSLWKSRTLFSLYVGFYTTLPSSSPAHHPLSVLAKLSRLGFLNSLVIVGALAILG